MSSWPSESIPDADALYYRISKGWLSPKNPEIHPGVFKPHPDDGKMSTDWEKYATAEDCRLRATTPKNNGVVELSTGGVREPTELDVAHSPRPPDHRAHADVLGLPTKRSPLREKLRLHLFNMVGKSGWIIRPDGI